MLTPNEKVAEIKAAHAKMAADPNSCWHPEHGCNPDRPSHFATQQGTPILRMKEPDGHVAIDRRPVMLVTDSHCMFVGPDMQVIKACLERFKTGATQALAEQRQKYAAELKQWQEWHAAGIPVPKPAEPRLGWQSQLALDAMEAIQEREQPNGQGPIMVISRQQSNNVLWAVEQMGMKVTSTGLEPTAPPTPAGPKPSVEELLAAAAKPPS